MWFFEADDTVAPLMKVHAHGLAAEQMGSDLIATRDWIDHTIPVRECSLAYHGAVRPAFIFCKNDGHALVVLNCDKEGMMQAINWMADKSVPFAETVS
jgi:hypothetical protein